MSSTLLHCYSAEIRDYMYDLIDIYSYKNYSDLSQTDKEKLVSLILDDNDDEIHCLTESKDLDKAMFALKKMLGGTKEDEEKFIETIKTNAINYYNPTMKELFYAALDDLNEIEYGTAEPEDSEDSEDSHYDNMAAAIYQCATRSNQEMEALK